MCSDVSCITRRQKATCIHTKRIHKQKKTQINQIGKWLAITRARARARDKENPCQDIIENSLVEITSVEQARDNGVFRLITMRWQSLHDRFLALLKKRQECDAKETIYVFFICYFLGMQCHALMNIRYALIDEINKC